MYMPERDMKNILNEEQIKNIFELKRGDRILLCNMNDDYAPECYTKGTFTNIDCNYTIHVKWDDGSTLGLIPGVDSFIIVPKKITEFENKYSSDERFANFYKLMNKRNKMSKYLKNFDWIFIGSEDDSKIYDVEYIKNIFFPSLLM